MTDDVRGWRSEDDHHREFDEEPRRREFDYRERWRDARRSDARGHGLERPFTEADFGWRRSPRAARESDDRDYSGLSWGLSGGHRQDRQVFSTGAGLESGYAGFHRPGAPDAMAFEHARGQGPHAGRGPRGYQRPDHRIREDVNDRLTEHGWIDATDIECKVENCEVLLTGFVDSRAAKRAAEDVAESVASVREVHNHLRVRTSAPDHEGVGRTSVLGLTESQTQTRATAPDHGSSRTRR